MRFPNVCCELGFTPRKKCTVYCVRTNMQIAALVASNEWVVRHFWLGPDVIRNCIKQFCNIETIEDFLALVSNDNDKIFRVAGYKREHGTIISQSAV